MSANLLLTVDEVAEQLCTSRRQVFRLIADQGLPVVYLGERQRRVPAEALAEWVRDHVTYVS